MKAVQILEGCLYCVIDRREKHCITNYMLPAKSRQHAIDQVVAYLLGETL